MDYSSFKSTAIAICEITARLVFAGLGLYALVYGSLTGAFIALIGVVLSTQASRDKVLPQNRKVVSSKVMAGVGTALLLVSIAFGTVASVQTKAANEVADAEKAVSDAAAQKAQALALTKSNRLAQQQSDTRLVQQKEKLVELASRMDSLFQRESSSNGWDSEALEIASGLNSQPQSDDISRLKKRWSTSPGVMRMASSEIDTKTSVLKREAPKLLRALQEVYLEKIDRILLDARIEAEVTIGKSSKGASLKVKSALVGRVFADQLANKADMVKSAELAGFSQLVFVNTIDGSSITYDLSPQPAVNTTSLEHEIRMKWAIAD